MIFVDGENFTIRGQEFAKANGVRLGLLVEGCAGSAGAPTRGTIAFS